MLIFTMEELVDYDIEQLRNIAQYFEVPLEIGMSKGRIIEKIYNKLEEIDKSEANNSSASVRVQRIRNSMKEK